MYTCIRKALNPSTPYTSPQYNVYCKCTCIKYGEVCSDNLQSLHHTSPCIAVDHLSPGMDSYTASMWWEGGGGEGTTLTYPPGELPTIPYLLLPGFVSTYAALAVVLMATPSLSGEPDSVVISYLSGKNGIERAWHMMV